jgi:hypothetical protein
MLRELYVVVCVCVCAPTNVCIIAADAAGTQREIDREQCAHIKGNVVGLRREGGGGEDAGRTGWQGFVSLLRASKRKDERAMKCFPLRDF